MRLIDGLDGDHGPGLAWNLGHALFLIGFVLLGVLTVGMRQLVPASTMWTRIVASLATVAGLFGVVCFLWVILGDLFADFHDAAPLPDALEMIGPLSFQLGVLTLLIILVTARPRRLPVWSPLLVLIGFVLFAVNLNLIPIGALLILAGLAPLGARTPTRSRSDHGRRPRRSATRGWRRIGCGPSGHMRQVSQDIRDTCLRTSASAVMARCSGVSKARLILTALIVEQQTVAEVAARYGVHRSTVHRLRARYDAEGEAAFEPLSRRPNTSPTAIVRRSWTDRQLRKQLTEAGLDAGPDTIAWHLASTTRTTRLEGDDQPHPDPRRPGRPPSRQTAPVLLHPVRSRAAQRDLAVRLHPLPPHRPRRHPGRDIEIITWLDDHSRYALHVSAHHRVTGPIVLATFRQAADLHGYPASTLTDNGMVYTTRSPAGRGGRNRLEHELRRLGIVRRTPDPTTPPPAARPNGSSRP